MIIPRESLTQFISERLGGVVSDLAPFNQGTAHRMSTAQWQQGETTTPILIRFFEGSRAIEAARAEAAALRELSSDCYPVPELYLLVDDDSFAEGPFIVMQQLAGQTLNEIARNAPDTIPYWLDKASDLLLKLHGLHWQDGYEPFKPVLAPLDFAERQVRWWARQANSLGMSDLETGFGWLRANLFKTRGARQQSLIHRDFHADNIMGENGKITGIVDWDELTIADPAVDVGWTRMILATEARTDLGDLFTADYARRNPDILETIEFWEMFAACKRLTILAAIKSHQAERLSFWSGSPALPRLTNTEAAVRQFMEQRLSSEDEGQ